MEIHNPKPLTDSAKTRAREAARRPEKQVPERARLFADDPRLDGDVAARERLVAELRAQAEAGTLDTPERIEAAARRMLGDRD